MNELAIMAIVFGVCCVLQVKTLREAGFESTATAYALACVACLAANSFDWWPVLRWATAVAVVAMMITSGMKLRQKELGDSPKS
ncbi:MAG: hypothetical protein EKK47_20165 [Burkholderiales bacterium]|nr:MAG: hypothetical protein EKK47_20165 [Burkholderiales bacterium]